MPKNKLMSFFGIGAILFWGIVFLPTKSLAQVPDFKPTPELLNCLRQAVGETAFREVSQGIRPPTQEEIQKGTLCFESYGRPGRRVGPPETPQAGLGGRRVGPPEAVVDMGIGRKELACVREVLGEGRFGELGPGSEPTDDEKFKLKKCFPQGPPGGRMGPRSPEEMGMTPETLACIKSVVGEARFSQLGPGGQEPTDEEKQKLAKCFPEGGPGGRAGPPPGVNLPPDKKECVLKILGGWRKPSEEEEKRIATECFGGEEGASGGPNIPPEKKECIRKILSGWRKPSPEEEKRIGQECLGGQMPMMGSPPAGSPPPQEGSPPPADTAQTECVKRILGGVMREPSAEEKTRISQECFGGSMPSR